MRQFTPEITSPDLPYEILFKIAQFMEYKFVIVKNIKKSRMMKFRKFFVRILKETNYFFL